MIIEPLKKKDGTIYTNVEINNMCYEMLVRLRDGVGAKTEKERAKMEDAYLHICGGSDNAEQIMGFMKQIYDETDERKAQELLARGLLPVAKNKKVNQKK